MTWDGPQRVLGSVRLPYFGPRPLIENGSARSAASTLVNAQVGYRLTGNSRLVLDAFNVLNTTVSDIGYFYTSRLPGERAGGVNDVHTHPMQPRTGRISLLVAF